MLRTVGLGFAAMKSYSTETFKRLVIPVYKSSQKGVWKLIDQQNPPKIEEIDTKGWKILKGTVQINGVSQKETIIYPSKNNITGFVPFEIFGGKVYK